MFALFCTYCAHTTFFCRLCTRPKSCFGGLNERWAATLFGIQIWAILTVWLNVSNPWRAGDEQMEEFTRKTFIATHRTQIVEIEDFWKCDVWTTTKPRSICSICCPANFYPTTRIPNSSSSSSVCDEKALHDHHHDWAGDCQNFDYV